MVKDALGMDDDSMPGFAADYSVKDDLKAKKSKRALIGAESTKKSFYDR